MNRLLSLGLIILLIVSISIFAFAHGGGYRNDSEEDYYRDELNLSTAQLDKMEELQDEYYDQVDEISDQLRDQNDELRDLYFAKDSDQEEIMEVQTKINQLRNELAQLRTEMHLELREILTAEQLDRMEDHGFMSFSHMMSGWGMMGQMFRGTGNFRGHHRGGPGMHGNGMMGW
ncbi:Spy/CpxP family protein refolding chaperone [Halanaerobaculum tunisiense]